MTSRVLGHYTVRVSVSVCLRDFFVCLFFMKDLRQQNILVNANLVSLLCIPKLRLCPHFECVCVVIENASIDSRPQFRFDALFRLSALNRSKKMELHVLT